MSIELTGSVKERRNTSTTDIDRLSTQDMLKIISQEDSRINHAIAQCLPEITRLVDNASAALSRGGRVVLVGAGNSGRNAMLAALSFSQSDNNNQVIGMIAGGALAMMHELDSAARDYDRGALDLQVIGFNEHDMLVAVTVNGKTPWVWGAMRHARQLGATVAVVTCDAQSESAQLADIVIAPDTGAEVVAGYGNPKAESAQKQILHMLTTGLVIRSGRTYGNLRVDIQPTEPRWTERQVALVMEACNCPRAQAKVALESCNNHCKTAIVMILTGLDAWRAHDLLNQNSGYVRMALQEAPRG
ncbi:N-acetylmuramic acid 6-phosphate etherase [Salmonella enterica subsp. enterica serovar Choleraesuis]|nr:N-acetylmuramic acid 6-phosphate etherase [Salmonella enterica subsp. enterica serovar Choleraesuis]